MQRDEGMLLRLDHASQSTPSELPEAFDGWVDPALCQDSGGSDPLPADETRGRCSSAAGDSPSCSPVTTDSPESAIQDVLLQQREEPFHGRVVFGRADPAYASRPGHVGRE